MQIGRSLEKLVQTNLVDEGEDGYALTKTGGETVEGLFEEETAEIVEDYSQVELPEEY